MGVSVEQLRPNDCLRQQDGIVRSPAGASQRRTECDRGPVGLQRAPLNDEIPVRGTACGAGGGGTPIPGPPKCSVREDAHWPQSFSPDIVRRGGYEPPPLEATKDRRSLDVKTAFGPFARL